MHLQQLLLIHSEIRPSNCCLYLQCSNRPSYPCRPTSPPAERQGPTSQGPRSQTYWSPIMIHTWHHMVVSCTRGTPSYHQFSWDSPLYTIHFGVPPFDGNPHMATCECPSCSNHLRRWFPSPEQGEKLLGRAGDPAIDQPPDFPEALG